MMTLPLVAFLSQGIAGEQFEIVETTRGTGCNIATRKLSEPGGLSH